MNRVSPLDPRGRFAETDTPATDHAEDGNWRTINLRALWSATYRRRRQVILIMATAVLIGLLITFLSTATYRATARIQIDQQSAQILQGTEVQPEGSLLDGDRYLQTQLDIIQSRSIAREVAQSLGLYRNIEGFLVGMGREPAAEPRGAYNLVDTQREQVIDAIQDNLTTDLPIDSRLATISFTSPDRQLSARVANAVSETYIRSNIQRKFDTSAYARSFLEGQLQQTRQRLEESERAVLEYARSNNLLDTASGSAAGQQSSSQSLTTTNLVQLNEAYSQAVANRILAEQKWREASGTPVLNQPEVLQNPAVQTLLQQRAAVQAEYDENSRRYRADYPSQVQASARIETLNEQIERIGRGVRDGVRQQYQIALAQENALNQRLTTLKTATMAEQGRGVRYNILRRDVDTNRALYDALLQRYRVVSATAGVTANNVSIVDRADPPVRPVWPKPLLNLAFALFAGLIISGGYIYLRDHFDDSIRSPEDVKNKLGVGMVGLVPVLPSGAQPIEELQKARSEFSEAYYALRTALELATPTGSPRTLIVTSSGPSEGKSTTSYALARSYARIGRRVLLIDADMRKPVQHKHLGLENRSGLSNVLSQHLTVPQVLQRTDIDNLDLIAAGPMPINPADLIAGTGLETLLSQMTEEYDIVLVDSPPVLGLADAPTLAAHVQATLFVVQANQAHGRQVRTALGRLSAVRAHVIGALLTKYDVKESGTHNDQSYSYSYGQE